MLIKGVAVDVAGLSILLRLRQLRLLLLRWSTDLLGSGVAGFRAVE